MEKFRTLGDRRVSVRSRSECPRRRRDTIPGHVTLQRQSGAVTRRILSVSGCLALAPDAFSYARKPENSPNAGTKPAGDTVQVCGYGFGTDSNLPAVTIGVVAASLQKGENISCP